MSKKEVLAYILVTILVMIITFLFLRIFAFEKKKNNNEYPKVTDSLIQELYNYIPVYHYYYYTYSGLSEREIFQTAYEYLTNSNDLEKASNNDLNNASIDINQYTPIAKIKEDKLRQVLKDIFNQKEEISNNNYELHYHRHAKYLADTKEYLIYEDNEPTNYIEKRKYEKYEITQEGNTLIIYDRYAICDITTNDCYKDEDVNYKNTNIHSYNKEISEDDIVNGQKYKHTFKYENGTYHWVSSELGK